MNVGRSPAGAIGAWPEQQVLEHRVPAQEPAGAGNQYDSWGQGSHMSVTGTEGKKGVLICPKGNSNKGSIWRCREQNHWADASDSDQERNSRAKIQMC